MPWNNTEMCYNNTTFGKKGTFCQILERADVRLPDADFFWIISGTANVNYEQWI